MGRGESVRINRGSITTRPIDGPRSLLAHGKHAMASIKRVCEAPPFILDVTALCVSERSRESVTMLLTAERTFWYDHRQEQDRKVGGAQEPAHSQGCHKEQRM